MSLDHFSLSAAELAAYRADGFLVREAAFSDQEIARLGAAVERAAGRAQELVPSGRTYILDQKRFVDIDYTTLQFEFGEHSDTLRVIEPVHELDEELTHLIDDRRLTGPVRSILGTDEIALWTDKLNLKRPGVGAGFGWHQDSPYWIHDSSHVDLLPNVMVTFDDATMENGCFSCIRGSHQQGCLPGTDDGSQLGGFYTNPGSFSVGDAVWFQVPAGSLIFFDPHIVHGSGPNHSDKPRRAMVITYQPGGFPTLKSRQITNVPMSRHGSDT
ncbi:MAG: phytanoyl-CoA dioxygenase family protein [Pseudomonadota bacterium]